MNRNVILATSALVLAVVAVAIADDEAPLTEWERNNIAVYKAAGQGVVYISSVALQWDYFLNVIPTAGSGSGAIIDERGHVLTNYHVIEKAARIEVTLADGGKHQAKIVGVDPSNDVAILRISAPAASLTPIHLGSSAPLQVGQKVLAIGNPFGLERTLTVGCVSSIGRDLRAPDGRVIKGVIQTDAAINPGNSGGPLLDSRGRIVGVNTAIFSPSGGSVGIGFAVPIDTIKAILDDLLNIGHPRHAWLGVEFMPLTPGLARQIGLTVSSGALIMSVVRNGPAHRAGLRGGFRKYYYGNTIIAVGGDLVTRFDGTDVHSAEELSALISRHRPNDEVKVDVVRFDGSTRTIKVRLGERPIE